MKIDKLILVSIFLLAVLTMGAASASGDVDGLAVDNETIDGGIADSLEDEDIVSDDFDEPLGNDEKHDLDYEKRISREALIDGYDGAYIGVYRYGDEEDGSSVDVTGNITMSVDGIKVYDQPVRYYREGDGDAIIDGNFFYYKDIPNLAVGNHNLVIRYDGDENFNPFEIKENFTAYYFKFNVENEMEINHASFTIEISPNATGRIDLFIDNKKKFNTVLPDEDLRYEYDLEGLSLGSHDYEVIYCEGNYPEIRQKGSFNITYSFYVSLSNSWIGYGDNVTFEITLPPDASDEVVVLLNGKTYSVNVNENGAGYIILNDFVLGENNVTFTYLDAKYPLRQIVETIIVDPKFEFDNNIPYKSQNHNITLSLPREAEGYLDVFVADEYGEIKYLLKKIPLANGSASYCVSNNPIGEYHFILKYEGDYAEIEERNANIKIVPNVMVPYAVMENEDYNITVSVNDGVIGNITITISPKPYYDEDDGYIEPEGQVIYNGTAMNLTFPASVLNLDVGEYDVEIHYSMDGESDFYYDYFNLGIRNTSRVWHIETDLPREIDRSEYERDQSFDFQITNLIKYGNGKLSLLINGKEHLNDYYDWNDLSFSTKYLITGINNWTLSYTGDGYYEDTSINGTFNVFGQYSDGEDEEVDDVEIKIYDCIINGTIDGEEDDYFVAVMSPGDATGKVNVYIDGKKVFSDEISQEMHIHPSDLSIALNPDTAYDVLVEYEGDEDYGRKTQSGTFYISDEILTPVNITPVNAAADYKNGKFTFKLVDDEGRTLKNEDVTITAKNGNGEQLFFYVSGSAASPTLALKSDENGVVTLDNANLYISSSKDGSGISAPAGQYRLTVKAGEYIGNVVVTVNRIDPDLKISVADIVQGKNAVVTISTDARFTGNVNVRIGSASYVVEVKNGKGSKSISNLKPGTYEAIATFHETDMFKASVKSVKFNVIKKADEVKLTLKKVKVKKSAKKLVLSATLKVNGKAVKGKKLTFKFNGKTLKAKTNKKGVAKVTVKKNVLKKLKVGKKVKYQVSYQKTTKKLTAKVKK